MIQKRSSPSSLLLVEIPALLLITSGLGLNLSQSTRDHAKDCSNKTEYFISYGSDVDQCFKVVDALEALKQFTNHRVSLCVLSL